MSVGTVLWWAPFKHVLKAKGGNFRIADDAWTHIEHAFHDKDPA
jgi:hypothetical protein